MHISHYVRVGDATSGDGHVASLCRRRGLPVIIKTPPDNPAVRSQCETVIIPRRYGNKVVSLRRRSLTIIFVAPADDRPSDLSARL